MESFALWCVRKQIARATAMLQSRVVAEAIDGSVTFHRAGV
jgi:hypothetical protein